MSVELAKGVSYCVKGDQLIFLDICKDRYIGADARCLSAQRSEADLELLSQRGLVIGSGALGTSIQPVNIEIPIETLAIERGSLLSPTSALAALWQMTANLTQKRRGLAYSIRKLQHLKRQHRACSGALGIQQLHLIAAFLSVSPFFDQSRNCLSRSLALAGALARQSFDARVIIGVKFNPFSAHAWVQAGTIALNDSIERIRHFHPIASF